LGDPDGMMWRLLAPGAVYEYWRQPRFEELGNAARSRLDESFRGKAYAEMSQIILENPPWIPVIQTTDSYGLQRSVEWKPYSNQQIELRAHNLRFRHA
jgi:peptide/nickel transport system substrate-binding protein